MAKRKPTKREAEATAYVSIMRALAQCYRHPGVSERDVQRVLAFAAMSWRGVNIRIVSDSGDVE